MRLGILIRDSEYRDAILEMISEFDREIFVEVANENGAGRESIILTDILPEELNSEQLARLSPRTIFLTPTRFDKSDGLHRAFKYGDISEIMSEIFLLYGEWSGDTGFKHPFSRMISVCTSNDSCSADQCRTLARAIIYTHGGTVLILPLGYINDYATLASGEVDSFKRMMYLIDSDQSFPIEAFSEYDSYGISYLKLKGRLNPIAFLDETYLNRLLQHVCTRFDSVILDLGACYRKENIQVVNKSDIVVCFENSRVADFSDLIGADNNSRAKHIKYDGTSDSTIAITDIVKDIFKPEGDVK